MCAAAAEVRVRKRVSSASIVQWHYLSLCEGVEEVWEKVSLSGLAGARPGSDAGMAGGCWRTDLRANTGLVRPSPSKFGAPAPTLGLRARFSDTPSLNRPALAPIRPTSTQPSPGIGHAWPRRRPNSARLRPSLAGFGRCRRSISPESADIGPGTAQLDPASVRLGPTWANFDARKRDQMCGPTSLKYAPILATFWTTAQIWPNPVRISPNLARRSTIWADTWVEFDHIFGLNSTNIGRVPRHR